VVFGGVGIAMEFKKHIFGKKMPAFAPTSSAARMRKERLRTTREAHR
jgi:hypothetical protein